MIEVSDVAKDYGPIRALDGVSFSVSRGEVVGFLGPNGAGKTTCMKILTGFISASAGTVTINGKDIVDHGVQVRALMGYLPENAPVYSEMTVREYLKFVAGIRGIARTSMDRRISETASTVGILDRLDQEIGTLSKGFRQRVGLAQAMIHNPEILILDEPTSGLDPNQIVEIRELIREIGRDRTVILSTHNLPEVTAVCNRVLIVHRGKIVADGSPQDIRTRHGGGNSCFVEIARTSAEEAAVIEQALAGMDGCLSVERCAGTVNYCFRVHAANDRDLRPDLFRLAVSSGWTVVELKNEQQDLETIFHRLTL
jgi:ABC-2 type transport system ATP-binding protein